MIFNFKKSSVLLALFFLVGSSYFHDIAQASVKNKPQLIAKEQINNKTAQPHPVFKSILPKLKKNSQIKILLPNYIPGLEGENPLYAIIETANKDKYDILLGFSPDCTGGTACRLGMISAEAINSKTPKLTGKAVSLAKGTTAYFVDAKCGANCSDSTLTWRQKAVQYTIGLKAGKQDELVKMAKSVISP
ncbi:hypothetical protein H6G06_16100 [Anabaena sphaerica FACHB-251]|uniref:Uncharacterized protein n=1 Tax=Anabaena sphaerica FACHB-251 TaxID=2692883 RepID=A0A926WI46_9NOST|nr:hypothetical protein [Anabaena sphaerica]MBD2294961.1 hypothetical protein [Anabaena sphaerica FACHB-251]